MTVKWHGVVLHGRPRDIIVTMWCEARQWHNVSLWQYRRQVRRRARALTGMTVRIWSDKVLVKDLARLGELTIIEEE